MAAARSSGSSPAVCESVIAPPARRASSPRNPIRAGDDLVVRPRLGVTEPEQAGAAARRARSAALAVVRALAKRGWRAPRASSAQAGRRPRALDGGARPCPLVEVNAPSRIPTLDGTPALKLGLHASTLDNLSTTAAGVERRGSRRTSSAGHRGHGCFTALRHLLGRDVLDVRPDRPGVPVRVGHDAEAVAPELVLDRPGQASRRRRPPAGRRRRRPRRT